MQKTHEGQLVWYLSLLSPTNRQAFLLQPRISLTNIQILSSPGPHEPPTPQISIDATLLFANADDPWLWDLIKTFSPKMVPLLKDVSSSLIPLPSEIMDSATE